MKTKREFSQQHSEQILFYCIIAMVAITLLTWGITIAMVLSQ